LAVNRITGSYIVYQITSYDFSNSFTTLVCAVNFNLTKRSLQETFQLSSGWDTIRHCFWGDHHEKSYLDIRVFSPPCFFLQCMELPLIPVTGSMNYLSTGLMTCISKKWSTAQEFSATRGMGHEANIFCKKLASLLSDK